MFSKSYWHSSFHKLREPKYLALTAGFIAMKIVLGSIYIPVAENLRIGITFMIVALEAAIIGPGAGMISGAVTDLLGFAIFPNGPFFAGYTLTAMAGELIYGLCFYQKKMTVLRIIIAKVLNNYLVNVLLGSLWSAMLYSKAYIVYATASLIKNTLLLPVEIVLLVVIFNLLAHFLVHRKLIPEPDKVPLPLK